MSFKLSVLLERLKGRGLDLAEEAGKIVVEETLGWAEDSAKEVGGIVAGVAMVAIPQIKTLALAAVDKIDGQIG